MGRASFFDPAPPGGLEPPTSGSEVRCSVQLSYRGFVEILPPFGQKVKVQQEIARNFARESSTRQRPEVLDYAFPLLTRALVL